MLISPFMNQPRNSGQICSTNVSTLNVICLNARSIMNKINILNNYLVYLQCSTDLLFITETWLNDSTPDSLFCPSGYHCIRNDRISSRGGGVLVLYRSNLSVTQIYSSMTINSADLMMESLKSDLFVSIFPLMLLLFHQMSRMFAK